MHSQEVFIMQTQYLIPPEVPQVPPYEAQQMAQGLAGDLARFLFPLLVTLDRLLDKRLVRTFLQTIQVILAYRDRVGGLLLSELGGDLLSPEQAPAESKRLSNLLHSPKWRAQVVEDELWQQASEQVHNWHEQGEEGLAIWDGSEWEKPESQAAHDLCAVRQEQSQAPEPHQAGLLQPAHPTHRRAGLALAGGGGGWPRRFPGSSSFGSDALVEQSRRACLHPSR
jgi:hypothetical protein